MFSSIKWYAIGAAFLAWSVGLWMVAGDVKENAYNAERLATAQATMKTMDNNAALASDLSKQLQTVLGKLQTLQQLNQATNDEVTKNPVYSDCRVTDGVRSNYKRKLQAQ